MPHFKCSECQHEWDGRAEQGICDWCGAVGGVLEEQTPLEQFIRDHQWHSVGDHTHRQDHMGHPQDSADLRARARHVLCLADAQTPPDSPQQSSSDT